MKEVRFFYDSEMNGCLPEDEAKHAVRVLRLAIGDEIHLMDGRGTFYRARITSASNHKCCYQVIETHPQLPDWMGHLHLAMAPTKLNDRVEWFAEKATEIGFDELSFLDCQFSERKVIKTDRIDRILISAMKQSHKAHKPVVEELVTFKQFISKPWEGKKYIAHCLSESGSLPFLYDILEAEGDATVLIGPEGDFSAEEVAMAEQAGFQSISLGESRLRTETAALVATYQMNLAKRK
jgi:16S rRNA (uracil1498-N3)-methyltransferase